MTRKTFNISEFKDSINTRLRTDDYFDSNYRQALLNTIESLLMNTGNYHGFRYLEERDVPPNQLPGIRWINGKPEFDNTDRTRVHYF